MNKVCHVLLCLCLLLSLSACAKTPSPERPSEYNASGDPSGVIDDLRRLPQNTQAYLSHGSDKSLISKEDQDRRLKRYETLLFAPWDQDRSKISAKNAFSILGTRKKSTAKGYLPNGRKWPQEQWDAMVANADRGRYPSRTDKVITVRRTNLREVPTSQARFVPPSNPSHRYPFDMFQYAALPPGMPLFVSHATRDRQWFFVENALTGGWVLAKDVALVDDAAMRTYKNGSYAAILHDDVVLADSKGNAYEPQTIADLGAVFPIEDESAEFIDVLVPLRNAEGRAVMRTSRLSKADAAPMPLPLTAANVAKLSNTLMNDPYGWGGYGFERDCSSTLRDIFTPFGVWLPRNSRSQSKAWEYVSLEGLGGAEKKARIKAEGEPFATLLWLPGHITLYIGEHKGEPVMFHNMWGIRVREPGKEGSGRMVVGKAVVTTTRPGAELPNVENPDTLLSSIRGMAVLR